MTEEVIGTAPMAGVADMDAAVVAASDAFARGEWRTAPLAERLAVLERLHGLIEQNRLAIADCVTDQMGAPVGFTHGPGVQDSLETLRAVIDQARIYPWEQSVEGLSGPALVRSEPVGVVAAIAPWNSPQFILMNKLAPALAAGCSVVLKPAPETPLDALLLARLIEQAGVPAGVVSVVPADREVSEHLVRHHLIDKVSFTGSTQAGRRIAMLCGESLTRVSLELGGKSAAIVLDDADPNEVANALQIASFGISGQMCVAQSRILAPRSRYTEVVDAVASMTSSLAVGDPRDPATAIGPLVARRQQERVANYIALGTEEGARVAAGGPGRPDGLSRGWFVRPTVFADVDNTMRIAQEEIFGPVVSVIPYDDDADAVRIANQSSYGLSGTVWTGDSQRGIDVARRIRTGSIGINRFAVDVRAPFGGFKSSGIGREMGAAAIPSFVETQTVML